jgi:hypothetical protein
MNREELMATLDRFVLEGFERTTGFGYESRGEIRPCDGGDALVLLKRGPLEVIGRVYDDASLVTVRYSGPEGNHTVTLTANVADPTPALAEGLATVEAWRVLHADDPARVEAAARALPELEGYVRTVMPGCNEGFDERGGIAPSVEWTTLYVRTDQKVRIAVLVTSTDTLEDSRSKMFFGGHVHYLAFDGKWRTFDRRGVDDSFYLTEEDDALATLHAFSEKAEASRLKSATLRKVPGTPFEMYEEKILGYAERLIRDGFIHLTPSGMGTGYRITSRCEEDSKLLPEATSSFFGVKGPLYYSTFDHD